MSGSIILGTELAREMQCNICGLEVSLMLMEVKVRGCPHLTSHILISSSTRPTLDSDKNPVEVISMIKCVTVISIIKRGISRQINL